MTIFKLSMSREVSDHARDTGNELPDDKTQTENVQPSALENQDDAFSLTNQVPENDPKMLIKIDGVAGRIFTEALNRVLATESVMLGMVPEHFQYDDAALKEKYPDHQLLHVKTVEGKTLAIPEFVEIQNDILNSKDDEYIVAVENADYSKHQNMKMYSLIRSFESIEKVKVSFSMEAAINQVLLAVRSRL